MSTPSDPRFPDVHVQLSGEDGNVFSIIGRVTRAMKAAGLRDEADEYVNAVMDAPSYDDALQLTMSTVRVH